MKKILSVVAVLVMSAFGSVSAFAQATPTPPDFTGLTGGINLTTVGVAILAVAGIMIGVQVISYGAKRVMAFFGR